ncbi:MAG: UMP kinase [bacterium]|nr:UMP kinase [bacterium]
MRRVLLKISGEALGGSEGTGIQADIIRSVAHQVRSVLELGIQVGMVVGGGNIFRGVQGAATGIKRVPGDFMGMLATIINAVAVQNIFADSGVKAQVMTPFRLQVYVQLHNVENALEYMSNGQVVLFAGGAGHPFFTTDPAAALRASEIDADLLIKATKVNGVYDCDPMKYSNAVFYDRLTFQQVLKDELKIMDLAAIAMCMDSQIPIRVVNIFEDDNILKICQGESVGTLIHQEV